MAVVAKFDADFTSFSEAVRQAEDDMGKFVLSAEDVDQALKEMSGTASATAPKVNSLQQSYKQFDNVLLAAGINIGPAVKAITEIWEASVTGAAGLGLLGSGATAVGVGFATFQATRSVIEKFFPDLDNWVANSTAKIMGWGTTTEQTAAAVADSLAKASAIAGRAVTEIGDAIAVITKADQERLKQVQADAAANAAWQKATNEMIIASQNHEVVLLRLNTATRDQAIFALQAGVSQQSVATALGMTASQMAAVLDLIKQQKQAVENQRQVEESLASFRATAAKQNWEIMKGIDKERQEVLARHNAEVAAEGAAQARLNAVYNPGTVTALSEYNRAMAALHATKEAGKSQRARETEIENAYAQALYDEAVAHDQARDAANKHADAIKSVGEAATSASAAARGWMSPSAANMQNVQVPTGIIVGDGKYGNPANSPFLSGMPKIYNYGTPNQYTTGGGPNITVNYPIMNDPQALSQLAGLMQQAIGQNARRT